ncbi:MAG: DUF1684 domain-containing protein [Pedobacter sp.]|nr:MAG: DUF1684 domain-containing protein [Pedobacter sp.]
MKYLSCLAVLITINLCEAKAQSFNELTETHRTKYKNSFLADPKAPLKAADMEHLHFFDPDSAYNVIATVTLLQNEKPFQMPTFDGTSKEFIRYAEISFTLRDTLVKMTLYKSPTITANPVYRDHLFLPFTDRTNGKETYGGGRYVDLSSKDIINGSLILDLNKAYNPYCAYSDGYRCPVPPEENDLPLHIRAGERTYTGSKKQRN